MKCGECGRQRRSKGDVRPWGWRYAPSKVEDICPACDEKLRMQGQMVLFDLKRGA